MILEEERSELSIDVEFYKEKLLEIVREYKEALVSR